MSSSAWFNSFLNSEKADRPGGGGGKPKIKFGRHRVPNVVYPRGGQQRFGLPKAVIRGRFVVNNKFSNAALSKAIFYYANDKKRGDKEIDRDGSSETNPTTDKALRDRTFFSRFESDINPNDVQRSLIANKGEKVAFHEMMISPGSNAIDLVDYTRHQMKALEDHLGHSLLWYGNVHRDTDHFHANVIIAGRIPEGLEVAERAIEKLNQAPERIQIEESKRTNESLLADEKLQDEPEREDFSDRPIQLEASDRVDASARELLRDDVDKVADKLIDRDKSIGQSNVDRAIQRADRAINDESTKNKFNSKGDVYLTRECYQAMREAGNSYTRAHLEPDRVHERTLERFDLNRDVDRERSVDDPAVADKPSGNSDSLPDLFGVNTDVDQSAADQLSDSNESADVTGSMTDFEPPDKSYFSAGDSDSRERDDDSGRDFPSSRG